MYSTGDSRHHQQVPLVIPPSPTLSNPDMILPFDEERENSTPSPPFNLPSLSHLQSFYENRTYPNEYTADSTRHGISGGVSRSQKKGGFPRHTWTYDGHDAASRRLSDIGEEDTSSTPPRGYMRASQVMSHPHRATESPISVHGAEDEVSAHSSSSSSTISGASETSSLDGTQGRRDSYVASQDARRSNNRQVNDARNANGARSSPNALSANEEASPDEHHPSAVLSTEAERILENAKKRLTLMEGNLTRARSSMRASPSLSPSSSPSAGSQSGLGQPVGGLYQSISRTERRSATVRPVYTSQDQSSNRHSRVYSETNVPYSSLPHVEPNLSRSFSAMGSTSTSNFHSDERSFQYAPTRAYLTHRSSISSMQPPALASIPGVRDDRESSDSPPGVQNPLDEEEETKISNMEEFNSAYPVNDPPSRSQSQLHVRDLQDQMKGLHIKISSLKVKAQEDNLRRRSLQSLRTPSPLTAATHWYANPLDPSERHSHLHPSVGTAHGRSSSSPQDSQASNSNSNSERISNGRGRTKFAPREEARSSVSSPSTINTSEILPPFELTDHDDGHSVVESLYEDAEEGQYHTAGSPSSEIDREALEEILREPLDDDLEDALDAFPAVPSHTDATPHEEREDAFDYEHFILHSALGNYTQARLRRQSNGSDTSVETTRPIQDRRSARHSRSNSANSLSTVATFATATEGGHDDLDSVLYWDQKFNAELRSTDHYSEEMEVEQQPNPPVSEYETSLRTPRASRYGRISALAELQRPESAATGSATPTSLASSLVSTVRAAASPHPSSLQNGNLGINEDDTRLLEQLFKSLGDVCMDLQGITTSPDCDMKQARLLRRRLEAARRVLDGELDA